MSNFTYRESTGEDGLPMEIESPFLGLVEPVQSVDADRAVPARRNEITTLEFAGKLKIFV